MAEFFQLSPSDRLDALDAAANLSGLPPHLLEKDIWVVWALRHLFSGPYADHLVFKGGTSLSKAYGVIRRFSEDVDLTYDIRAIASDLVGDANAPLPTSKSPREEMEQRDSPAPVGLGGSRDRAPSQARPHAARFASNGAGRGRQSVHRLHAAGHRHGLCRAGCDVGVRRPFHRRAQRTAYHPPAMRLHICKGSSFRAQRRQVMRAERTFWEKATAIHVFCIQGAFRGSDRFARHWHDVTRLDAAGFAEQPSRTKHSPAQLPITRVCSLQKRTRKAKSSTITLPSPADSNLYLMTMPWPSWPPTINTWSMTACSWMTSSRSRL
jgi:hypothetical protein